MITRRASLIAIGATAIAPLACLAQQGNKIPLIGYLSGRTTPTTASPDPNVEAFRQGLRELGYVEGKTIFVQYRYAGAMQDRADALVAELLRLNVDVLVSPYTAAINSAKNASSTVPIVIVTTVDPVAAGIVGSLARPGANITGLTRLTDELGRKRLGLLNEVVPDLTRVGVLWHDAGRGADERLREFEAAAHEKKLQIRSLALRGENPDLEGVFKTAFSGRGSAIIWARSPLLLGRKEQIADIALKHRLPSMCEGNEEVEAGGLISYAPNDAAMFRRAATYVDKILKGAKPADLPIEQPTTFDLVINMKTAKKLGIKIPQSILVQVTKVIE